MFTDQKLHSPPNISFWILSVSIGTSISGVRLLKVGEKNEIGTIETIICHQSVSTKVVFPEGGGSGSGKDRKSKR